MYVCVYTCTWYGDHVEVKRQLEVASSPSFHHLIPRIELSYFTGPCYFREKYKFQILSHNGNSSRNIIAKGLGNTKPSNLRFPNQ